MAIVVEFAAQLNMSTLANDQLESNLDALMERLQELGAPDPAVSGSLASGHFEVELTYAGDDLSGTLQRGLELIIEALTSAGFGLPDAALEEVRVRRELVSA